jgi:hypothetical protein
MVRKVRKVACGCLLTVLVQGGTRLEARPWRTAVAAAMALAALGHGRPHPPDGPAPTAGGMAAILPFHVQPPMGPEPYLGVAAGAGDLDLDAAAQGTCSQACETQANLDLIHCETYLQMQALRNLCITRMLTAEEQCGKACLGR